MGLLELFILLVVFQFKHFVADYPLQIPYMLKKFRPGWDYVLPLTTHCLVHAFFTLVIVMHYSPALWWLVPVDFVTHFIMDRVKASPKMLGRYTDMTKTPFWAAFGFDQMFHHIVGLYIVWEIIKSQGLHL